MADISYGDALRLVGGNVGFAVLISGKRPDGTPVDTIAGGGGRKLDPIVIPIDGTPREILAADVTRRSAVISNTGAVDAYLGATGSVSPSAGLKRGSGDILVDNESNDAWWACTDGSEGQLTILVVRRN